LYKFIGSLIAVALGQQSGRIDTKSF